VVALIYRMRTKPFNEDFLWKGKLQRAEYASPVPKAPMNLPKINTHTGKPYPTKYSLHDEQCLSGYEISKKYWTAEMKRREAYREKNRLSLEVPVPIETPPILYESIFRLAQ